MSPRGHETDGLRNLWHHVVGANCGVRDPPSRPHHSQSVQECYIVALTPQLTNCVCGLPFQFVLETNVSPPDASSNA